MERERQSENDNGLWSQRAVKEIQHFVDVFWSHKGGTFMSMSSIEQQFMGHVVRFNQDEFAGKVERLLVWHNVIGGCRAG